MLISQEQCKFNVADKEDIREAIGKICFEKEGAVSTDGKRILVVPYPVYDDNDLFETEESKADAKYKLKENESILIDADTAKHLAINFFKEKEQENHVGRLAAVEVKDHDVCISMVSDIVNKEFKAHKSEQDFPNWKQIIPKSETTGLTAFDIDLLIDTLKKIKGASRGYSNMVEFRFRGDINVVEISTNSSENGDVIRAYVMPMRDRE